MSLTVRPSVRPLASAAEARAFLALPATLGGAAAGWSVALEWDTRRFFNPGFNGFLASHRVERFLAWRGTQPVGRVAVALRPGVPLASFGFLALEPDSAVLAALLARAEAWAKAQGATGLRGPLSLSINHEVGAMVSGFARPPVVRMPHTPPWLPAMLQACGLVPEKAVLAKTFQLAEDRHTARFARLMARWPHRDRLRLRPLDWTRYEAEVQRVCVLFNEAWAGNWGAEPVGPAEALTIARLMRPLLRVGFLGFAEWDGAPMGVVSAIPNLDEATAGLNGHLLPFGWLRLARLLARGRARQGRVPMLGITREFRGHPASGMALGLLFQAAIDTARQRGWQALDCGWMLEDNHPVLQFTTRLGAVETGRWQIYNKLWVG